MFVKNCMTPNPITVTEDTNIFEALKIMQEHKIRRLPVLHQGRLVGIVTQLDLYRVSPSPATTLSVFEMNYLLSKMTVKEVMARNLITVSPEATIEEAALLMREHDVGGLPVVEGDRLVGIITETDLFDALIDLMGLKRAGIRLTLEVPDRPGVLADITQVVREAGVNIISLVTFQTHGGESGVVMRLATQEASGIIATLRNRGYAVTHQVTF